MAFDEAITISFLSFKKMFHADAALDGKPMDFKL